jgi:hypothetical protein
MKRIGVISLVGDLHARVVAEKLSQVHSMSCALITSDAVTTGSHLTWSTANAYHGRHNLERLPTEDGKVVALGDLDLIWWRRTGRFQVPDTVTNGSARRIVERSWQVAILGLALTRFHGAWVSDPVATSTAENKLLQLEVAEAVGLRVPRTIVSQDPATIRAFVDALGGRAIVKTLAVSPGTALETGRIDASMLSNDPELEVAPAIYQEEIPGTRHLRINCFGERLHTALLTSERLDWRVAPDQQAAEVTCDAHLGAQVIEVIRRLGLRMGIVDVKLTPDGEPVWLELNPQGQWGFLEGMCGMPLVARFAEFLADEVHRAVSAPELLAGAVRREG